jgi:hypothetical protein
MLLVVLFAVAGFWRWWWPGMVVAALSLAGIGGAIARTPAGAFDLGSAVATAVAALAVYAAGYGLRRLLDRRPAGQSPRKPIA